MIFSELPMPPCMIAAIPTPLQTNDQLCHDGLVQHLNAVWDAGMDGVLIGGSMGLMQMLTDATWHDLLQQGSDLSQGRGEVLLGVGDTSTARTLARIDAANHIKADGVVILTPYLWHFDDDDLFDYYRAVAEASRHPVYLYDLPSLTGRALTPALLTRLVDVPQIHGIKCSGAPDLAIELERSFGERFRVVMAQPHAADIYLRAGFANQLDGVYALAPRWTVALAQAAGEENWEQAQREQAKLTDFVHIIRQDPYRICDALWRLRGWPGTILSRPIRPLSPDETQALKAQPIVEKWLASG